MSDTNMVRKIVFLLNSLMIDNAKVAKLLLDGNLLQELDITLVKYTKSEAQDEDMIEKVTEGWRVGNEY